MLQCQIISSRAEEPTIRLGLSLTSVIECPFASRTVTEDFIAEHPALTYKDYWDADHRPYERQWPEYRAAVKRAKDIRGRE